MSYHASHDGGGSLAQGQFSLLQNYLEGGCEICVVIAAHGNSQKVKLIARVAPTQTPKFTRCWNEDLGKWIDGHTQAGVVSSYLQDSLVFACSGNGQKRVELAIPSEVWLFRANDINDPSIDTFQFDPNLTLEIGTGFADWEIDAGGIWSPKRDRRVTDGLIKNMPDVSDGSVSNYSRAVRDASLKTEAENLLSRLIIYATDYSVSAILKECVDDPIKFINCFYSAID